MSTVLTDRGRATAAAGSTLAAAGVLLGFQDLTRLGLVAVCLVLSCAALVRLCTPRVEVEIPQDRRTVSVGTRCHLPIRLSATHRTPALLLEQPLPAVTGGGAAHEVIPSLRPPHRFNLDLSLTFPTRGRHVLAPCRLIREDPFGFASRSWTAGTPRTVTVLPRIHPLDRAHTTSRGLMGVGHVSGRAGMHDEDSFAIREYVPGDDLRRVHWPATAHRGDLMTRHEEGSVTPRALLVLDPGLAEGGRTADLEWGVEMAASVAAVLHENDLAFELLVEDPRSGGTTAPDTLDETLLALAVLPSRPRPAPSPHRPDPFVERLRTHAGAAGAVILIASARHTSTADLLLALPPSASGMACLVGGASPELIDVAARAGWTAHTCTHDDDHAVVWSALAEGR